MSYDNTNKGTLGDNERKEKDSHPDMKGRCDIKCEGCGALQPMWISGWNKNGSRGAFTSLAFEVVKRAAEAIKPKQAPKQNDPDFEFNDDIPY